jgi:hypothetical protein
MTDNVKVTNGLTESFKAKLEGLSRISFDIYFFLNARIAHHRKRNEKKK